MRRIVAALRRLFFGRASEARSSHTRARASRALPSPACSGVAPAVLSPQPCLHPYTVRGDADVRAHSVELCICRNLPSLPWSPDRCLLVSQATPRRARGVSMTVTSKPRPSTTRAMLLGLPTLSRGPTKQRHGASVQTGTPFHVLASGAVLGSENPALEVRTLSELPPLSRLGVSQPCDALTVHLPDARMTASVDGFQPVGTTSSGLIIMARRETASQV